MLDSESLNNATGQREPTFERSSHNNKTTDPCVTEDDEQEAATKSKRNKLLGILGWVSGSCWRPLAGLLNLFSRFHH